MKVDTKRLTVTAMLVAYAYMAMALSRILPPIILFLKYDPKDIIIVIGGFMYGPLTAAIMSVAVSLVEMVTVGTTGFFGFLMNVISTCAFVCPAAFIYNKRRSLTGAAIGLAIGVLFMSVIMLGWNYLIAPLYMEYITRETVKPMLFKTFLPFNLLKGGINAAGTVLLYKPIMMALKSSDLAPPSRGKKGKINVGALIAALFVLLTCVLIILLWTKK